MFTLICVTRLHRNTDTWYCSKVAPILTYDGHPLMEDENTLTCLINEHAHLLVLHGFKLPTCTIGTCFLSIFWKGSNLLIYLAIHAYQNWDSSIEIEFRILHLNTVRERKWDNMYPMKNPKRWFFLLEHEL